MPSRARPIGNEGAVSIAQLWAAYLEVFEGTFGDRGILEGQLAGTRENISRYFDEMRQRFLDSTGFVPTNRDLYEYVKHFHEPKHLRGLEHAGKYSGNLGYVHPNQMLGKLHIRRYYDQVLAARTQPVVSEQATQYQFMSKFIQNAFDDIRNAWGDMTEMALCLVNYGYIIVGEFMHDTHGFGASEAKQQTIEILAAFISKSTDKERAVAYLQAAWVATERNAAVESALWPDWRATCKDFLELAKRAADSKS